MVPRRFLLGLSAKAMGIFGGFVITVFTSMECEAQVVESADPRPPPASWRGIDWKPFPNGLFFDDNNQPIFGPIEERDYPIITGVHRCSPADSAGVLVGDLLVRINGRDAREVPPPFHDSRPGVVQELELRRGQEYVRVSVREVAWPTSPIKCERGSPSDTASANPDTARNARPLSFTSFPGSQLHTHLSAQEHALAPRTQRRAPLSRA